MIFLRQSTASQEVPLGYFLDSTDGDAEETALTIANTDIKIWKHGATTLANKNSGGGTHISNGIYYAVLDATDTNTIGNLVLFVHKSGALAVKVNCVVLDEAVYDVVFGTTALSTYAGGDTSGVTTLLSRIGTPANLGGGASIAQNLSDIEAQTDDIGAAGAGLTAIPWNAAWDAEVQSEATDALNAYDPPTKAELDAAVAPLATAAALDAVDNFVDTEVAAIKAVTDKLDSALELDGGVYRYTTNALEQAPTGGSAPTAAAIADAVWDEDPAGHTTPGTYGELVPNMETDVDTLRGDLENSRGEPGQGDLPVSASILSKIDYLFKFLRNKKDNDGTQNRLYADDGTTVDHKQTTSVAGGTVTKGEWTTGA